jgi:hypothetical protein
MTKCTNVHPESTGHVKCRFMISRTVIDGWGVERHAGSASDLPMSRRTAAKRLAKSAEMNSVLPRPDSPDEDGALNMGRRAPCAGQTFLSRSLG